MAQPTGYATAYEEFLFPDQEPGALPTHIDITTALNGRPGVQVVVAVDKPHDVENRAHTDNHRETGDQARAETPDRHGDTVRFQLTGEGFSVEWFHMIAVPVEYNTGDGQTQGGDMVTLPDARPEYAIRKAPFKVYDCLRPITSADGNGRESRPPHDDNDNRNGLSGQDSKATPILSSVQTDQNVHATPNATAQSMHTVTVPIIDDRAALYLTLQPNPDITPGRYRLELTVETSAQNNDPWSIALDITVVNVIIPPEQFHVSNWFSLPAISRMHHADMGSPRFLEVLDQYIEAMRRTRQDTFFIEIDQTCVTSREPYTFDFEYLTPIIERFFAAGMTTLEIGPLLSRGFKPDGMPNMLTDAFTCAMAPNVPFESTQGYDITTAYLAALAAFLQRHGWQRHVLVHIHDEPDVHCPSEGVLAARRRQYYMAVAMLKKHLPDARVLEAIKTDSFRGGLDVWIPTTSGYEAEQRSFERMRELGDEAWNYVCCEPEGHWLNRFLDQKVIHSRLLFWGFEYNRLSGFLHWGFNQFPEGMNPFQATSCHNPTGLGTNFPCGDAFIVYPGNDGPWLSMRLEAERRGTEDLELLRQLRERDPELHNRLIAQVFRSNTDYSDDEATFNRTYRQLLGALAE